MQAELNAALDTDLHNGASNNTFATAQSLESAFINLGSSSQQRAAVMGTSDALASWNLNTNPGWSTQGQWAFGQPAGGGGAEFGYPDPTSGHTGNNVYGVNLSGDYGTNPGGPYYLKTTAIKCTGYTNIQLNFWRWLNTDNPPYVTDTVDVSNNGATWTNVYTNSTTDLVIDDSWQFEQYDIHTVADNHSTVYIRWGYTVKSGATRRIGLEH